MVLPDRELPHAIEAERLILGAFIEKPSLANDIVPQLNRDDFSDPVNQATFDVIHQAIKDGIEIDPLALAEALRALAVVPDPTITIFELMRTVAPDHMLDPYVQAVKQAAKLRRASEQGQRMMLLTSDGTTSVEEIAAGTMNFVDDLVSDTSRQPLISTYDQFMKITFDEDYSRVPPYKSPNGVQETLHQSKACALSAFIAKSVQGPPSQAVRAP